MHGQLPKQLLTLPLSMTLPSALSTACLAAGSRATGLPVAPLLPFRLPAHSCGTLGQDAPGASLSCRPDRLHRWHLFRTQALFCCPRVMQTGPITFAECMGGPLSCCLTACTAGHMETQDASGLVHLLAHGRSCPACMWPVPGRFSRLQWGNCLAVVLLISAEAWTSSAHCTGGQPAPHASGATMKIVNENHFVHIYLHPACHGQAHHPGMCGPPCASLVLQHLAQTPEWLQTLLWWRWQLCSSIEVLP